MISSTLKGHDKGQRSRSNAKICIFVAFFIFRHLLNIPNTLKDMLMYYKKIVWVILLPFQPYTVSLFQFWLSWQPKNLRMALPWTSLKYYKTRTLSYSIQLISIKNKQIKPVFLLNTLWTIQWNIQCDLKRPWSASKVKVARWNMHFNRIFFIFRYL